MIKENDARDCDSAAIPTSYNTIKKHIKNTKNSLTGNNLKCN